MTEITRETQITPELLAEFKSEYRKIYKTTTIDGQDIYWRRLTRSDYKEIMAETEGIKDTNERLWEREELVCRRVVVYPCKEVFDEFLRENAGTASILSDDIYEKSGFRMTSRAEEV